MMLDLDAIKAREKAATPGPWAWEVDGTDMLTLGGEECVQEFHVLTSSRCPACAERDARCVWPAEDDREFIAHARTDVPALVDKVESLRRVISTLNNEIADLEYAAWRS